MFGLLVECVLSCVLVVLLFFDFDRCVCVRCLFDVVCADCLCLFVLLFYVFVVVVFLFCFAILFVCLNVYLVCSGVCCC